MRQISRRTHRVVWYTTCACALAAVSVAARRAENAAEVDARMDTLRQLYEASNIYAFNAPVLVEEMAIAVKLPPGATGVQWASQEPGFTVISLPGRPNAVLALDIRDIGALLEYLRSQGQVTVLRTCRWTALNNSASIVQGGRPTAARPVRRSSGESAPAARSRDNSIKVTLNIKGIDAASSANADDKVLDFNLMLDMRYVRDRGESTGSPSFDTLNADIRAKLVSGQTMLIEDVNDSEAVLFLLTLTLGGR